MYRIANKNKLGTDSDFVQKWKTRKKMVEQNLNDSLKVPLWKFHSTKRNKSTKVFFSCENNKKVFTNTDVIFERPSLLMKQIENR